MNLDDYLQKTFQLYNSKHKFDVILEAQGKVSCRICVNDCVQFDQTLTNGRSFVSFCCDLEKFASGYISIEMYGKGNRDTVVHNGQIIKDKTLHIIDVKINNVSLDKNGHIHQGIYTPIYWDDYTGDRPEQMFGVRVLGFNGVWRYNWNSSPLRNIIDQFDFAKDKHTNDKQIIDDINEIFSLMDIKL